jgi:hypothetical protein
MRPLHRPTRAGVTVLLGSLMLTGFAAFEASGSFNDRGASVVVNRANKSDQLRALVAAHKPSRSPAAARTGRPPFGCDPLFSPITEPAKSGLYYRCAA